MEKVSKLSFNLRIGILALTVFVLDQVTKFLVLHYLGFTEEKVVVALV